MTLHRALVMASVLILAGISQAAAPSPAEAQASPFPPPPGQSNSFPPPPGQAGAFPPPGSSAPRQGSPFPPPGQQQPAGKHPCEAFVPLREAAEKGAQAIQQAGERKAPREEVCALFQRFTAAEARVTKFLETNQTLCGVPPEAVKQAKANHGRTVQMRTRICSAAPAAPAGPSLSDALGSPAVVAEPPKAGRGTLDTLTGNVLNR